MSHRCGLLLLCKELNLFCISTNFNRFSFTFCLTLQTTLNTYANSAQNVDKGCRKTSECLNTVTQNNNIVQNTQCCTSNGCNLLINPVTVTTAPVTTTIAPVQGILCYTCTDCGNNIGVPTTCPTSIGYSCFSQFVPLVNQGGITVNKGCAPTAICSNLLSATCCSTNQCNTATVPPVTSTMAPVTTVVPTNQLQCYSCTNCGFMNIGTLTTCPSGYSCTVRIEISSLTLI